VKVLIGLLNGHRSRIWRKYAHLLPQTREERGERGEIREREREKRERTNKQKQTQITITSTVGMQHSLGTLCASTFAAFVQVLDTHNLNITYLHTGENIIFAVFFHFILSQHFC